MPNPLFNAMMPQSPMSNFAGMMADFAKFRNSFRGDPKQQVEQLLQSGQMSQQQYQQLSQMASQMMQFLK